MKNVSPIRPEAKSISRREQRKQEVRGRINEAALSLFGSQGFELTTVEEICEAAEVARKTFYNYYGSKQDLIRELSDSMLYDETSNVVALAIEKFPSTRERLGYVFSVMVDNLQRYEDLERCLIHQTLMELSSESSKAGQQLGKLNNAFVQLMREGRALGDVTAEYSVEFAGEMVMGAINTVIMNWIHDPAYPLYDRIQEVNRYINNALLVA